MYITRLSDFVCHPRELRVARACSWQISYRCGRKTWLCIHMSMLWSKIANSQELLWNKKAFKESLCLKKCMHSTPGPKILSSPSAVEHYWRSLKISMVQVIWAKLPVCSKNLKGFTNPIEKMDFSMPDSVYKVAYIILSLACRRDPSCMELSPSTDFWKHSAFKIYILFYFNYRINDLKIWSVFVVAFCFCDWRADGENLSPSRTWALDLNFSGFFIMKGFEMLIRLYVKMRPGACWSTVFISMICMSLSSELSGDRAPAFPF